MSGIPEMGVREALERALEALEEEAIANDTASPEGHTARLAIDTVRAMLAQRGCEHLGRAMLCEVCDEAIFG